MCGSSIIKGPAESSCGAAIPPDEFFYGSTGFFRTPCLEIQRAGVYTVGRSNSFSRGDSVKRLLTVLLVFALLIPAAAGNAEDLDEKWMQHAFQTRKVVGGAVIVSRYGETVFSYTYGSKVAQKRVPVTLDTCFRIASVTKLVTAIGLMQLYDRGYYRLDDPINRLLPFRVVNTTCKKDQITVRQVLSHTTGVKQTQSTQINWDYVSARSTEGLFEKNSRPGRTYEYSNANGALFGALIEALTGQSVNTYMAQNVFSPLDINAAYTARLLPDPSDLSNQMNKKGINIMSPERAMEQQYKDTCDPAEHLTYTVGGLYISAEGLNRLGMLLCNEGWLDGKRILSPYTVRLMQADQRDFDGTTVYASSPYGLGMQRVEDRHGNIWYGHQGMKEGLSSDLFYLPEKGLVVTVIANGYLPYKEGQLVSVAIRTMEKAAETDWDRLAGRSVPAAEAEEERTGFVFH